MESRGSENCGKLLIESQYSEDGKYKSCPRCSMLNGEEHVYFPYPSGFGTSYQSDSFGKVFSDIPDSAEKSSPRTVSTYRDSFTLYLRFMTSVYSIAPDRVEMNHFSLDHLSAFGIYLETIRNCSPSTINLRMSAIKSFLKRKAMEKLDETSDSSFNYKPSKSILAFLASL